MKLPSHAFFMALCAVFVWNNAEGADSSPRPSAQTPNVMFILVDDMGWQDTSVPFHYDVTGKAVPSPGNAIFKTPGMETLASQGMIFTQAYAASVCSPTRTSIMTGNSPARTHISNWTHPAKPAETNQNGIKTMSPPDWRKEGMVKKDPHMPDMFRKAGYRTIFVGKAHFGPSSNKDAQPEQIGFDVNLGGTGAGHPASYYGQDNYAEKPRKNADDKKPRMRGLRDVPDLDKYHGTDTFLTDALSLEMRAEIEKSVKMKKPFLAYLSHYAVHSPFMKDPQFESLYPELKGQLLNYATLISGMDKSISSMLDALDKAGVAENTLVVFASDNGGTAPKPKSCLPLRGMKGTPYEGGIRTPMIVCWAKLNPANPLQKQYPIKPGSRCDKVVALHDWFATFGAMIGGKVPSGMDSCDVSGLLRGDGSCKRPQSYFLNYPHDHNDAYYVLYREGDWKAIYRFHKKKWELYNLKEDIGEKNDLAAIEPAKMKEMAEKLVAEHKRHDAQFPIEKETGKPATFVMPSL